MINWSDLFAFRQLIAPVVIRIVFWIGVIAVVLGGLKELMLGDPGGGLIMIILGPIVVRVIAEILLVPFLIHARLTETAGGPQVDG